MTLNVCPTKFRIFKTNFVKDTLKAFDDFKKEEKQKRMK